MVTFATGSYFIFSNGNYALSAAINIVILLILILLISRFTRLTKAGEGVSYG
jgi:hypothetical protein